MSLRMQTRIDIIREMAAPLMEYLRVNHHPHCHIVVETDRATLHEEICSTGRLIDAPAPRRDHTMIPVEPGKLVNIADIKSAVRSPDGQELRITVRGEVPTLGQMGGDFTYVLHKEKHGTHWDIDGIWNMLQ